MITRAHIRRQLRASGGITNVMPREGYFLGSIVRGVGKGLKKVANVAKQVVKSPIGKAALIGLGASMLGPSIGAGFKGLLGNFAGKGAFARAAGGAGYGSGSGLLGLLSKGKAAIGGMSAAKLAGGAGLLSYFMSKGASKEEAKSLASDVERGAGMGFDQIQRDIAAYRSGEQDESQMAAKGYRFLTPRNFVGAAGGRVGLQEGSPEEGIKSLEAGASSIKVEGDVRPPEMKMQEEMKMAGIPKDLTAADAVRTFELSNGRPPKDMQEVIDFFKNRKLSAMGGIMDMPMGNMRRSQAGVMERDYRDEGGFVPVGVKEKADDVPAMLSKNEFVMTADAVRGAGNGNIKKGAQRMYDLMKQNEGKVA